MSSGTVATIAPPGTPERTPDSLPGTAGRGAQRVIGAKFLTFSLDGEEYGLEILKVQEIIGVMPITPVPQTPKYVLGVINLRGKVIPVVDLRLKFGMPAVDHTEETCIIVVEAQALKMGVLVDKVSEVLAIPRDSIEDAPAFGVSVRTDFILGIGKMEGKVKLLLDIDQVLTTVEVADLQAVSATA